MNYEELTVEALGQIKKHIVIHNENGSVKTFPADNSNPEFLSFLQALEKENDPYFTQWVEAGNDPDEFWTQTGEI